jgi:hypothetical protein
MITLLPYVEFDEIDNTKETIFLIAYNIDMINIMSIEPDDKGRNVIYHKIGNHYTFNVAFFRFMSMLSEQSSLSLWFDKEIDKVDRTIRAKLR